MKAKRKIFDAVDLLTEDTSAQITEVKAENGRFYQKQETWIESEHMYEVLYEITI